MTNTHDAEFVGEPPMVLTEAETALPETPDSLWQTDLLLDAFRSRHFGQLLKAYRISHMPPLKQVDLAVVLGLTQGQISRIERSSSPVTDLRKLTRWAHVLRIPAEHLWFDLGAQGDVSGATSPAIEIGDSEEDVRRRALLKTMGLGACGVAVTAGPGGEALESSPLRFTIGKADLEVMREMTGNLRRLDNRFGGGHAYSMVHNYVTFHVEPILRSGRYGSGLRVDLFLAAAQLYQLAGWMAYDSAEPGLGHKHLRTALRLCEEVRNDGLAAEMLAGMSHQASFNRQPESATDLASAASYIARRAGIPKLRAEAAVMEASALAVRGDRRGCISSLQQAELHLAHSTVGSPEWLAYFDEAYMSAKFGHALRDLGCAIDAERFARSSLQMTEGYERGRLFNTALLAGILADQGKVEEAVAHAHIAVRMSTEIRSARAIEYLIDVRRRLLPYSGTHSVQTLYRSMSSAGVPHRRQPI